MDVLREIGGRWRELGAAEQAEYADQAATLKAKYEKAVAKYRKSKEFRQYEAEKRAFQDKQKVDRKKRALSASPSPRARKAMRPKRKSRRRSRRRASVPKAPKPAAAASPSPAPRR